MAWCGMVWQLHPRSKLRCVITKLMVLNSGLQSQAWAISRLSFSVWNLMVSGLDELRRTCCAVSEVLSN